jgi:hypothetical protein
MLAGKSGTSTTSKAITPSFDSRVKMREYHYGFFV